ncbi:MAG: hypothetical protein CM1200mP9_05920 [Gammaproteobacteria bacterium]|nr:MAG: hypothetical protein CM1200mP9_05920 [Gammaproteobacteria bacterium]
MAPDGYPHAIPLGYFRLGKNVIVGGRPGTQKALNVERNPQVSLTLESGPSVARAERRVDPRFRRRSHQRRRTIVFRKKQALSGGFKKRRSAQICAQRSKVHRGQSRQNHFVGLLPRRIKRAPKAFCFFLRNIVIRVYSVWGCLPHADNQSPLVLIGQ